MDKEKFSRELRLNRESRGWSREELAKMLDVSQTSVQNWENPNHNSFPKPRRWAIIYEVTGIDCMMHRYGVPLSEVSVEGLSREVIMSDKSGLLPGRDATPKHSVILTDLEYLLFTLFRATGSDALGESCLKNMLGIAR